jgi:predicted nuclease of predicted toxin-antitoxin system
MQFLANENFPRASVYRLRAIGHNVASILEDTPGAKDQQVLARAATEKRIILTFDRDYSEMIYRLKLPVPTGVIYFRFNPVTPEEPADRLIELLATGNVPLSGMFSVIERGRLRQRQLL